MDLSYTEQKIGDAKPSDVAMDENSSTEYVALAVPSHAGGVELSEGNYEQLRRLTNNNGNNGNQLTTASNRVQWENVSNRMKYVTYSITAMLVVLVIIDIVVIVIIALPKKQVTDGGWTDWGNWSTCSASRDAGLRKRSRSCSNPSSDRYGKPCDGDATEVEICNNQPCRYFVDASEPVIFNAYYVTDTSPSAGKILVFSNVLANHGAAYNRSTGVFVAPKNGTYTFYAQHENIKTPEHSENPDFRDIVCLINILNLRQPIKYFCVCISVLFPRSNKFRVVVLC